MVAALKETQTLVTQYDLTNGFSSVTHMQSLKKRTYQKKKNSHAHKYKYTHTIGMHEHES